MRLVFGFVVAGKPIDLGAIQAVDNKTKVKTLLAHIHRKFVCD